MKGNLYLPTFYSFHIAEVIQIWLARLMWSLKSITHNELDQMYVKVKINLTGTWLYYKKKKKNKKNRQKLKSLTVIWKTTIIPQLQLPPVLKQVFKYINLDNKITLPIIFHMPPWEPLYLFWGLCYFSFCARWFSTDFWQRMSRDQDWSLLILQAAKPSTKKKVNVVLPEQISWISTNRITTLCRSGSRLVRVNYGGNTCFVTLFSKMSYLCEGILQYQPTLWIQFFLVVNIDCSVMLSSLVKLK